MIMRLTKRRVLDDLVYVLKIRKAYREFHPKRRIHIKKMGTLALPGKEIINYGLTN